MKKGCLITFGVIGLGIWFLIFLASKENRLYRHYDFERTTVPAGKYELTGSLRGSWNESSKKPQITHRESPYTCFVQLRTPHKLSAPVTITILEIVVDGKNLLEHPVKRKKVLPNHRGNSLFP